MGSAEGTVAAALLGDRVAAEEKTSPSASPNEFLVAASGAAASEVGLLVVDEVGFSWTLVKAPDLAGLPSDEAAEQVAQITGFEVQPNYLYQLADDPLFSDQWALENTAQSGGKVDADIDIREAWSWTTGDPNVLIAVLDTGADLTHPDLEPNYWTNTGEVMGNGIDDDGNGYVDDIVGWDVLDDDADPSDTHGHGTFVSTVAAAAVNDVGMAGVAPDARLMPVRVCDSLCPVSAIVGGIAFAIANGADVMNLSFGGSAFSAAMVDALEAAADAGVSIVAAAGNLPSPPNNDLNPFYPASYDIEGLISVAATDRNDNLASFSHYGAVSVDLGAPGQDLIGGDPTGTWTAGSGTSYSVPLVSGAAALVKSVRPDATPEQTKQILLGSVDQTPGLGGRTVTEGRLNAAAAVEMAISPAAVGTATPTNGTLPFVAHLDGSNSHDPVGEILTWSWKLPDGSVVAAVETDWSPSQPGAYKATLTVIDDDGLSDSAVVLITASLRPGGTFIDDNEHFAEGAIESIAAEGITQGCNPPVNDRFCPRHEVTRGQMAAFLARALRLPSTATDYFGDDDESVFEQAINKLAAAGITIGCNPPANNRYCPDDDVTRGQMAAFLARAFELADGVGADSFVDDDDSVFETAIDRIAAAGITTGCNPPINDHYCPDLASKRGEMAVFLIRALGLMPFYPPQGP